MEIEVLKSLCSKLVLKTVNSDLIAQLTAFAERLKNILISNQKSLSISDVKQALYKTLLEFDDILNNKEAILFETLGLNIFYGQTAIDHIENIIRDQNFDPQSVVNGVLKYSERQSSLLEQLDGTANLLFNINVSSNGEAEKKNIIQMKYDGSFEINNLDDLKHRSEELYMIFRGYCLLQETNIDNIQILKATKSSPFEFDLTADPSVCMLFIKSLPIIYKYVKMALEFKKAYDALKKISQENSALQEHLEKEEKDQKDRAISNISTEVINSTGKVDVNGEVNTAIKHAAGNLYEFTMNGGTINIISHNPAITPTIEKLAEMQSEIQSLQRDVQLLLDKKPSIDSDKATPKNTKTKSKSKPKATRKKAASRSSKKKTAKPSEEKQVESDNKD